MKSLEPHIAPSSEYFQYTPSLTAQNTFFYPICTGDFLYESGYELHRNSFDSFLLMYISHAVSPCAHRITLVRSHPVNSYCWTAIPHMSIPLPADAKVYGCTLMADKPEAIMNWFTLTLEISSHYKSPLPLFTLWKPFTMPFPQVRQSAKRCCPNRLRISWHSFCSLLLSIRIKPVIPWQISLPISMSICRGYNNKGPGRACSAKSLSFHPYF